jgi:hypothetical protein
MTNDEPKVQPEDPSVTPRIRRTIRREQVSAGVWGILAASDSWDPQRATYQRDEVSRRLVEDDVKRAAEEKRARKAAKRLAMVKR